MEYNRLLLFLKKILFFKTYNDGKSKASKINLFRLKKAKKETRYKKSFSDKKRKLRN